MDILSSKQTEFDGQVFKELFYENEVLIGYTFRNCIFEHCTFFTCDFQGSTFVHCEFRNCNISAVKVKKTRFEDVRFVKSKVIGIDWTDKFNFKIRGLAFEDSAIDYSVFNGITLQEFTLLNCQAHEVDFIDTDLSNANCSGTDFERSNFLRTKLKNADLRQAKNYLIDPTVNKIKGIKLSLPEGLSLLKLLGVDFDSD